MRASELAARLGLELHGNGDVELEGVSSLTSARNGTLSFLVNDRYKKHLQDTAVAAVILKQEHVADCPVTALVADDPYLAYAKAAQLLFPAAVAEGIVHSSAVIGNNCRIDPSVSIGPHTTIGDNVTLDAGIVLGAGVIIEKDCHIGAQTIMEPRVTIMSNVQMGQRCLIHSGAVLGSDGFGFAQEFGHWIKIPQVGRVIIGDDVEIGANTTVDRGAIDDTIIEDGVKLDNLIQVAHNVHIGAHTAIAGCTGIAGSATIGSHCAIGGGVGITGHIEITDHVTISGMSFVSQSIRKPGSYSSGVPLEETSRWRRNFIRFRQLDEMAKMLKKKDNK